MGASRVTAVAALALVVAGAPAIAQAATPQESRTGGDGSTSILAAYTLVAPRSSSASGLVARAVIPAGAPCPSLDVGLSTSGSRSIRMTVRSAPATTSPAFDSITVCSAPVPVGATAAMVAGRTVPARLPDVVDRIAMFADSGCRILGSSVQDCASSQAWPLSIISSSIARERPDAVLFIGDFFYRESACPPEEQAECGSSPPPVTGLPITDSAYGWIADALLPMTPLLPTTPLIMTRGNHEACNRGGNGYFLLFDPREGTEGTCAPVVGGKGLQAAETNPTPTYAIDLPVASNRTLRLAIVDSAGGSDTSVTSFAAVQRVAFEQAAALTRRTPGRESWVVSHRPIYGIVTTEFATPGKPFSPWTSADQTAAAAGLLGNYDLVVSSHVHIAESIQLPGLPGQLVLGNGGTLLDPATGYPLPTTSPGPGYPVPSWGWTAARFGYAIATPNPKSGSWRFSMRDATGSSFARCGLLRGSLFCADSS